MSSLTGKVKWFNNKSGFGFITVCDGDLVDKDIFVHYSSIKVKNSQYKYLVQGEYVNFSLTKPDNSSHEYHAIQVSGIKGGELMCETRRQNFTARPSENIREDISGEVSNAIEKRTSTRKSAAPIKEEVRSPEEGFRKVTRKRSTAPRREATSER